MLQEARKAGYQTTEGSPAFEFHKPADWMFITAPFVHSDAFESA